MDSEYWQVVWKNFKSGDREAFKIIYNEFIDSLFSYGFKITSDRDLVKDSIQDLFIDVYTYGSTLNKPASLEFYLFKTLKRIMIRKLIEQKKYTSDKEVKNIFDLDFSVEDGVFVEEIDGNISVLRNELSHLKPTKQELIFLKFNSGLTYKEIGTLLDVRPNTVKKQIYRILDHLRKKMAPEIIVILLVCFIA